VAAITQALKDVRPPGWGLSQEIMERYLHLEPGTEEAAGSPWRPGSDYFHRLVQRMVLALDVGQQAFPHMDWRFSEFPNEGCHAMYVTCVELMTLPMDPALVGEKLLDVSNNKCLLQTML
jgi:mediator of RNA polymerase II transcription subunit 23